MYKTNFIATCELSRQNPEPPDTNNIWQLVSTAANNDTLYFTWQLKWTKEEKEIIQSMWIDK